MKAKTSEEDDFYAELEKHNFPKDDWSLLIEDVSKPTTGIYKIRKKVTVNRISTGKTKVYAGGHGTAWVCDFANDLSQHCFD